MTLVDRTRPSHNVTNRYDAIVRASGRHAATGSSGLSAKSFCGLLGKSMRPQAIVLLYDSSGQIHCHYFFYDNRKALAAFRKAEKPDADGFYQLCSEDGSTWMAIQNAKARLEFFHDCDLRTKEEPYRSGFLNLKDSEVDELAQRLKLPLEIIQAASHEERYVAENTNARKKAEQRHNLSPFLLKLRNWLNW